MQSINHRFIETNGIKMHIVEQESKACHSVSLDFQNAGTLGDIRLVRSLAERNCARPAVCGQTDQPESVEAYNILPNYADIVGLVHAWITNKRNRWRHDQRCAFDLALCLVTSDLFKN